MKSTWFKIKVCDWKYKKYQFHINCHHYWCFFHVFLPSLSLVTPYCLWCQGQSTRSSLLCVGHRRNTHVYGFHPCHHFWGAFFSGVFISMKWTCGDALQCSRKGHTQNCFMLQAWRPAPVTYLWELARWMKPQRDGWEPHPQSCRTRPRWEPAPPTIAPCWTQL